MKGLQKRITSDGKLADVLQRHHGPQCDHFDRALNVFGHTREAWVRRSIEVEAAREKRGKTTTSDHWPKGCINLPPDADHCLGDTRRVLMRPDAAGDAVRQAPVF